MRAHYNYLIVGGGIAGATAAEVIRDRQAGASIAILSAEPHPLYSRVLLPAYLKARISRDRVFLRGAEDYAAKRIDFYPASEVHAIDTMKHIVKTDDHEIGFDKLLIATGGTVKPWRYESVLTPRSYRLQTIDDADRLLGDMPQIHNPLVIGASFIALEFVEIFLQHGIIPKVVAETDGFFSAFMDKEGSRILEDNLARQGVSCVFGASIAGCRREGSAYEITVNSKEMIRTDACAIGIGIERNRDFLAFSDIMLGERGVKTDEYLETNIKNIYSAGDTAEYYDLISGTYRTAGNWAHAVAQGKRAGLNMGGERVAFTAIPNYAITNCGMRIAAIGECGGRGIYSFTRRSGEAHEYTRLFMRDGVLVGAFLINRPQDRAAISDLIYRRTDLSSRQAQLQTMAFDIATLVEIK